MMTRQELWEAMLNRTTVTIRHAVQTGGPLGDHSIVDSTGTISDIGLEDGSGYSFIVTLNMPMPNPGTRKIYVRCRKPSHQHAY